MCGSSYSDALVFRPAAENPSKVAGVVTFSPASGRAMVDCRARAWATGLKAPVAFFRPESEIQGPASFAQRAALSAAGAESHVIEHGVHGSSMLVDSRTGHVMHASRRVVNSWLKDSVDSS